MRRRAGPLETVWVEVPDGAVEAYEAAFSSTCDTVGFFFADEARGIWRVEGVRDQGVDEAPLRDALALAAMVTGVMAPLQRAATEAEGWVTRTREAFPEQRVGQKFAVRGTHENAPRVPGRITLVLDAGLAFGSGEHGSTRGCLLAFEHVARRRPCRILDLGTGSGILAIAAAKLLHRPVLATDIEPWSVRVAEQNASINGVTRLVHPVLANGWHSPVVRTQRFNLVFANILARPLCRMARDLASHLAPGGTAILSGLLSIQARMVLVAHRRCGLHLVHAVQDGAWTTLVVRKTPLS